MRRYSPDYELEQQDWSEQHENTGETNLQEFDDGYEQIPWDETPVMTSRKGFYKGYGSYSYDYYKIPQNRRRDYAFHFVDRTYFAVIPGDVSPVDGKEVTEEHIAWLHRARDREVYRNNKEKHQESDDYDLLEAVEEEKVKMEKCLPNCYVELKGKLDEYRRVINTEAIVDEYGNDCTDHMMAFAGAPSVEIQLGLGDDPLEDAFEEVEASLTETESEVYTLVYLKGLRRTTAAKMLGIAESTVRYYLKKAEKKVKENPVIARIQRIYQGQYERLGAWEKEKKAQAKRYEANRKKRKA